MLVWQICINISKNQSLCQKFSFALALNWENEIVTFLLLYNVEPQKHKHSNQVNFLNCVYQSAQSSGCNLYRHTYMGTKSTPEKKSEKKKTAVKAIHREWRSVRRLSKASAMKASLNSFDTRATLTFPFRVNNKSKIRPHLGDIYR